MYQLSTFYQSKTWVKLTKIIRQERVNENGEIICDYCKKPITKAYDCICHHKIALTDENINDVEIALNPNNIILVHHKCHNLIHEKFKRPHENIYLVYGAPLSGKSTFVKDNAVKGDLILDIDNIWQSISGQERYIKPYQLKQYVFKIRDTILEGIRYRLGTWTTAYIIGGYPFKTERDRLLKELNAKEIFINCTKEECLQRLKADTQRNYDEWEQYINKWFDEYIE